MCRLAYTLIHTTLQLYGFMHTSWQGSQVMAALVHRKPKSTWPLAASARLALCDSRVPRFPPSPQRYYPLHNDMPSHRGSGSLAHDMRATRVRHMAPHTHWPATLHSNHSHHPWRLVGSSPHRRAAALAQRLMRADLRDPLPGLAQPAPAHSKYPRQNQPVRNWMKKGTL